MTFFGHIKYINDVIHQFCVLQDAKIVENSDILPGKICNTPKIFFRFILHFLSNIQPSAVENKQPIFSIFHATQKKSQKETARPHTTRLKWLQDKTDFAEFYTKLKKDIFFPNPAWSIHSLVTLETSL